MSLEDLVREVRDRTERELLDIQKQLEQQKSQIERQTEEEIQKINAAEEQAATHEVNVESTRIVAAARLQARKALFEAKEKRVEGARLLLQQRLKAFTSTPEYYQLLQRMAEAAIEVLGEDTRLVVRKEDAGQLAPFLGVRVVSGRTITSLGGLVAESADHKRRVSMTFEDILRWKEDKVSEILSRQ